MLSALKSIILFAGLLACSSSIAAPAIPQDLVNQLKAMSPAEQQALAKQYGMTMPTAELAATRRTAEPAVLEQASEPAIATSNASEVVTQSKDSPKAALQRFGSSFFANSSTRYASIDVGLVPTGYILGPGDELEIQVFGKDAMSINVVVGREGKVVLPRIGPISVLNLPFEEAKSVIQGRIEQSLLGSQAYVTLSRLRQIVITVSGEARSPGTYNVSSLTTLSQALYIVGGISSIGSYRDVQVLREGEVVAHFDLYDLLLNGDSGDDAKLQHGDMIYVPIAERLVVVTGQVRRPAIYEMLSNENYTDLVEYAGGYKSGAYPAQTTVQRFDKNLGTPVVISINNEEIGSFRFEDGDLVSIPSGAKQIANPLTIRGAVVRPGVYEVREGNRISSFINSIERDLLPSTDLSIGLLVRRRDARLNIEVIPFDVGAAIVDPTGPNNLLVQEYDELVLLPLASGETGLVGASAGDGLRGVSEARRALIGPIVSRLRNQSRVGGPENIVSISGAVRQPGEYPLLKNGSLEFLIQLAGGLEDSAYLEEAEIRRISTSRLSDRAETLLIKQNLRSKATDFRLLSRDAVRINYIPDWNPNDRVIIEGEVKFPGSYALRRGETIGSLLTRAGGINDEAFVKGIQYFSKSAQLLQRAAANSLLRTYQRELASQMISQGVSDLDLEQLSSAVNSEMQGRLVIDPIAILAGDESADVVLQNGDSIFVPKQNNSVAVVGEVYQPGSFPFKNSVDVEFYLDLAAGATKRADRKKLYVVAANGTVVKNSRSGGLFRFNSVTIIQPGSTIVVPPDFDYEKPIDRYGAITSVVFQSVASIAAFFSIASK